MAANLTCYTQYFTTAINQSLANSGYMVWFFGGGETRDNRLIVFTGSFICLMKQIMGDDFDFIRGIYYNSSMINVIRTLLLNMSWPETTMVKKQKLRSGKNCSNYLILKSSTLSSPR